LIVFEEVKMRVKSDKPGSTQQGKPAIRTPVPCGNDQFPAAGRQPNQLGWYSFVAGRHPEARFIDVGAGMGAGMAYLAYLGASEVRGFDTDPRLSHLPKMTIGDSPLQAFGEKSADVVTCMDTIEHVLDDKAFFDELLKIAKTVVYISTPNLTRSGARNGCHAREYTIAEFTNVFRPDELWVASPDGWYHLQQLLETFDPAAPTTTMCPPGLECPSPLRVRCVLTQETWLVGEVPLDHVFNEGSPDTLEWAHFCGVFRPALR
jgi:Methyltransferase domain